MKIAETYNVDARFKVGDRVRVWHNSKGCNFGYGVNINKEYTVEWTTSAGDGILLKGVPMEKNDWLVGHHWEVVPKEENVERLLNAIDNAIPAEPSV